MKNFALFAILLASTLVAACGFQSKTSVLMPTAPSSVNASTSVSASSASSASSSSSASTSASSTGGSPFAGSWASPTIGGLPNIQSCTNLTWQISNLSPTEVAGSMSAVCGGSVTVNADLTGKLNGSDIVDLTAKGQAVAMGITCGFTLTGVGTRQTNDSMKLDYQGSTCLGPVSGSEMLRRASPAPAPAPSPAAPEAPKAPEPDPIPDDDVYGCTNQLPNKQKYVECIHERIRPTNEHSAFEVTKRVAWGLRHEGAGLLLKPAGENIVTWRGYTFAAGRILYADGHLYKVISDVGPGGANGPMFLDEGFLDAGRRLPALDPRLP